MLLQTTKPRVFASFQHDICPCDRNPHRHREKQATGLLDFERLDRPVLLRIVQDGPVRAELAHLGTSNDTLLQPRRLIQVSFIDQLESVDVGLEVFREEVVIVMTDGVQQPR